VPLIATITGEGGSGGAIALAAGNRVLILEHSIYSVISPEGGASILWRDGARAKDAAEAMKITAEHLLKSKIVDRIIEEPPGGAHSDPKAAFATVGNVIEAELEALSSLSPDQLRQQRAERFYAIGRPDTTASA
jgi:acetyl-CoA carboxylase carboxyl transferase subunit alpha